MNYGSNLLVSEGTLSGEETVNFHLRFREMILTNDSGSSDLTFKFNTSETGATLKPTETITMKARTNTVILSGSSVPYRLWGIA